LLKIALFFLKLAISTIIIETYFTRMCTVTSKSLFIATFSLVLLAATYFYAGYLNQPSTAVIEKTSLIEQEISKPYVTLGLKDSSEALPALELQVARDGLPMVRPLPPQKEVRSSIKDKGDK
jgi:hypothetical protein